MNKEIFEMRIDSSIFDWDIRLFNIMKKNGINKIQDLVTCLFLGMCQEMLSKKKIQNIAYNLEKVGIVLDEDKLLPPMAEIRTEEEMELERQIDQIADELQIDVVDLIFTDEYMVLMYVIPFSQITYTLEIHEKECDKIKSFIGEAILKNVQTNVNRENLLMNVIRNKCNIFTYPRFSELGYEIIEDDKLEKKFEYAEEDTGYYKNIEFYRAETDINWRVQCYQNNRLPVLLNEDELKAMYDLLVILQNKKNMILRQGGLLNNEM